VLGEHLQLKGFVHSAWNSFAVCKRVPTPIAERLSNELNTMRDAIVWWSSALGPLTSWRCAPPPNVAGLKPRARFAQCMRAYVLAWAKRPAKVQILLRLHTLDASALAAISANRQRAVQQIRIVQTLRALLAPA
jgi:hypothetical protein